MLAKSGFCYAVLTTDGTCKFGRTADAAGRIAAHVVSAEGFGAEVERVYLTEQVRDCYSLEDDIFSSVGVNKWHTEYCQNMTRESVEDVFRKCGVEFYSGRSIQKGGRRGEVLFSEYPYTIRPNRRSGADEPSCISEKVLGYVSRLQPVRRGVLINRVRSFDPREVAKTIDSLEQSGEIKSILIQGSQRELHRYVLPDYEDGRAEP